jgi:hypothetical protein
LIPGTRAPYSDFAAIRSRLLRAEGVSDTTGLRNASSGSSKLHSVKGSATERVAVRDDDERDALDFAIAKLRRLLAPDGAT